MNIIKKTLRRIFVLLILASMSACSGLTGVKPISYSSTTVNSCLTRNLLPVFSTYASSFYVINRVNGIKFIDA